MTMLSRRAGKFIVTLVAGTCGLLALTYPEWRAEAQRQGYYRAERVTICHRPGTPAERTLVLSRRAAERRVANLRAVFGACGSEPAPEITQTFFDLEPTEPTPDEIAAPPVDEDTTFPPLGPPVEPGPPCVVDGHFWDDGGAPEDLPDECLEEASTDSLASFTAAASPEGHWRVVGSTIARNGGALGDVAIHAALLRSTVLPSGAEILFFAGDAHTPAENLAGGARVDRTGVFKILDSAANRFSVERIDGRGSLRRLDPSADLFCSGHAMLEDGRLLVAGGTDRFEKNGDPGHDRNPLHNPHFTAIVSSFIFDPKDNTWSKAADMNFAPGPEFETGTAGGGRWYPTLLTLNSGRVLAMWGHPADDDDTRHTNDTPEYFDPSTGLWSILGRETDLNARPSNFDVLTYPRAYLLPNGRVFRATPVAGFNVEINPILESVLPDRNKILEMVSLAPGRGHGTDISYTSALLPLSPANRYRARILLAGGARSHPQSIELTTKILRPDEPFSLQSWRSTPSRELPQNHRLHANVTILPTGEVFMSGGKSGGSFELTNVLEGEIYNPFRFAFGPASEHSWRTVAPAEIPREYHSVASLMPDGRVWHGGTSRDGARGIALQEHRIDLYEPWYFTLTRPVIHQITGPEDPIYLGAPLMHLHDTRVTVTVDHFRDITGFALVRAGSVTHAWNFDQRYIELNWDLVSAERRSFPNFCLPGLVRCDRFTFRLTSPPSSSIAPPGNYLLVALDDRRVPSVGRFIRIDRQFVGELQQEAEDFTTRGAVPVTVRDDGTLALLARTEPFTSFPRLEYGGVDFGPEEGVVTQFSALVSASRSPRPGDPTGRGVFVVRLDRPDGPEIARLPISFTDGAFVEQTASVAPVSGVHNVFITFAPDLFAASASATVDWFKFKQ